MPSKRTGARRSSGSAIVAMMMVNTGIVDTRTEATPLSIFVSDQAISVNGMTLSSRASNEILPTVAGWKLRALPRTAMMANTYQRAEGQTSGDDLDGGDLIDQHLHVEEGRPE